MISKICEHSVDRPELEANACDVSVLVIAHRESLLVHRTLRSVNFAVADAVANGLRVEVIVVLDRGDERTRACIQNFAEGEHRVVEVNFGDLALSREAGRKKAKGEYIALLDGDDLYGETWITDAVRYARSQGDSQAIYHAEYQVFFEADNFHVQYFPSEGPTSKGFRELCLVASNHWTSILFFNRRAFEKHPFIFISRDRGNPYNFGYGFEDWHWISEQIARGCSVQVVPNTCNFVRRKRTNSMLAAYSSSRALLPPTRLLSPTQVNQRLLEQQPVVLQSQPATTLPATDAIEKKNHALRRFGKFVKNRFPKSRERFRKFNAKLRNKCVQSNWVSPEFRVRCDTLRAACLKIHDVEPKIYPTNDLFHKTYCAGRESIYLSYKYQHLCDGVANPPTHVFLVPWLKRGGSDLETLNYIHAMHLPEEGSSALVVSTEDSDSPWKDRLPEGVHCVDFGKICSDVGYEDQKRLLGTFLVQLGSAVIHNVNSRIGYQVFREYADALSNQSKLFASVFCEDITAEGRVAGYAVDEVLDVADRLTAIFADNNRILNKLKHDFGLPAEKLHLHYQPIEFSRNLISISAAKNGSPLRVLWAGRMDRQKRVDLLLAIAKQLEGHPIHFSVYGGSVLGDLEKQVDFGAFKNVSYFGAYDSFSSLPHDEFDVLLHTAQWEGLPNVLLESLSVGLPVIASSVGGVPELVMTGRTGIAIDPYDSVQQYCDALLELHRNRDLLATYAQNGSELVRSRHSWNSFLHSLRSVPHYSSKKRIQEVA